MTMFWKTKNKYQIQKYYLLPDGYGILNFWVFFKRMRHSKSTYSLDVLWGQPIKLIQVASNSELHENQWNDLLFFEIVPSHCFGASEVQT